MSTPREELLERRDQALRDLTELDEQVAAGEITPDAAARLRARYEVEAANVAEKLDRPDDTSTTDPPVAGGDARGTSRRRWAAVGAAAVAAVAAAALLLPRALTARPPGGFVTGNEAAGGRDLSTVTNEELEQVVAENPDIVPMRVALARRYFEAEQYERALDHYQQILQRETEPPAEVLRNVGWILFTSSDETQAAANFVEESLRRSPDDPLSLWFLAVIRLDGLHDPDGAAELARRLLERDDLGPDERDAIEQLLDRAQDRTGGGQP